MRNFFLSLLILCILINSYQLTLRIIEHSQKESSFLGDQFKELSPLFKKAHLRKVGYYTDKNMEETQAHTPLERAQYTRAMAQFEQAQYILAPITLDLNDISHPFIIFDCSTPQIALQKINDLGLKPIQMNNLGIILAFNPKFQGLEP
jgi:hypothetical protein